MQQSTTPSDAGRSSDTGRSSDAGRTSDAGPRTTEAADSAGSSFALERHGIAHVDPNRRYGRPRGQFSVRFAPVIYLAGMYLGASGGPLGLGLVGSLTALILANFLGSVLTGWCAAMGPRLGMPQLPMGRAAFGYFGNYLPAALSLLIFIGYYSVGTVLGAKSLADLLGTPYVATTAVVAALSILIGIYGYQILHALGRLITNASIVVLTVVTIVVIFKGSAEGTSATATGSDFWLAWFVLFTAAFGYTASWAPYASDYSRYLPEDADRGAVSRAAALGLFTSTTWMMGLGAALITFAPHGDVLDTFSIALPEWLRYVVLLTLGLSAIPHNSVNLYSGAMATLTCDVKLPQWVTVVAGGLIGFVVAVVFGGDEFQANFLLFLHVISYYITPWVAVLLVDYYLVHRVGRTYPSIDHFYSPKGFGGVNVAGMTSLIVGVLVSVPFVANDFYTGPIGEQLSGADVSYFVSGVVAAVMYWVWSSRSAPDRR